MADVEAVARHDAPVALDVHARERMQEARDVIDGLREGQVFYIHNRVQRLEKAAAKIRELVPEARDRQSVG